MEEFIHQLVSGFPIWGLLALLAGMFFVLGKGADMLVDEAVTLSLKWGVSKLFIGVTLVSLGTTLPEVSVSVYAAFKGHAELAMGNAVGSMICNMGLILGLALLCARLPFSHKDVRFHGRVLTAASILLTAVSFPFSSPGKAFSAGGQFPQWMGIAFLCLLALYLWYSMKCAKQTDEASGPIDVDESPVPMIILKLLAGTAMVIISSQVLIPTVGEIAVRFHVPESIIAATLVAFGTSLPELITVVTAVRKGHGELAIGNVVGANILNALLVAGASAAVTKAGLEVPSAFFKLYFPAMLALLLVFGVSIKFSKTHLARWIGGIFLGIYLLATALGYTISTH